MSLYATGLLLMVIVIFCPAVGQTPFNISVTRDIYQAEEHSNITLTWLLHVNGDISMAPLYIDILSKTSIFLYDSKSKAELYPHEYYTGRVWCDPELARKGRIECLLTDLKLSDAGTYQCYVMIDGYSDSKPCVLNVTAASDQPVKETSKPESRGRIGLYAGLGLFTLVTIPLICYFIFYLCAGE